MLLIALLYLICASTFTISKAALSFVSPIFFTGARMTLAGAALLTYYSMYNKRIIIPKHHWYLFAQVIIFYIYCAYVFDIVALQHLTSAKACLLYDLSPFLSALFSYLWFHEKMTLKKWMGLLIGCVGFLPVLMAPAPVAEQSIDNSFLSWSELIMLLAVVSSVYGWVLIRQLVKDHAYSSVMVNGVGMLGGGLLAFITSFFLEGWSPSPVKELVPFVYYTLLIIIVSNIVFSNFYSVLLKRYSATLLSFAGFTAPLFAAVLGWIFLGETVSWDFFMTTFFVFIGLYMFYQEELRQGYIAR